MAREFEPTPEQQSLGKFLGNLWSVSSQNLEGKTTQIFSDRQSEIDVSVKPLVERSFEQWLEITDKLLVEPPNKRKKLRLMLWDAGIEITETQLDLTASDGKNFTLPVKYSSLVGVAHLETNLGTYFPPKPEDGRPGTCFRITEIFPDSRRKIRSLYTTLIEEARKRDFDKFVRSNIIGTRLSAQKTVGELLTKLDSSLLTYIELVGRVTFYDTGRKVYQPVNLAGFQFIETLDGSIYISRLDAPQGYNFWKPIGPEAQAQAEADYVQNFAQLDRNLSLLANVLRQPAP